MRRGKQSPRKAATGLDVPGDHPPGGATTHPLKKRSHATPVPLAVTPDTWYWWRAVPPTRPRARTPKTHRVGGEARDTKQRT